jgi:hypothetical protein
MHIIPKKRLRILIEELIANDNDMKADVRKALKQKNSKYGGVQISGEVEDMIDKKIVVLIKKDLKRALKIMVIKKNITLTKDCFEVSE